ncbi:MAG: hypothetical protein ACYC69_05050 [Thermodesulfovibrionales bacterium]
MKWTVAVMLVVIFFTPGLSLATGPNAACELIGSSDLKPLLDNYGAPKAHDKNVCLVSSEEPGRDMAVEVPSGTAKKMKAWMKEMRIVYSEFRAKEITFTEEPSLGPDAFSARTKGDELRNLEIYVLKDTRGLVVKATWSLGEPITDATYEKLLTVVKSMLDKLP